MVIVRMIRGDVHEVLSGSLSDDFGAVLTDPPYGLKVPSASSVRGVPGSLVWRAIWRHLFPGALLLSFAGPRVYHVLATEVEKAGFEITDCLMWLYGSGGQKSRNIGKALQAAGHPRAEEWQGYYLGLKPAWQPCLVARKPRDRSSDHVAADFGVGAFNIGGNLIGNDSYQVNTWDDGANPFGGAAGKAYSSRMKTGRHPPNVSVDGRAAHEMCRLMRRDICRYFYTSRVLGSERTFGVDENDWSSRPTLKPIDLCEHYASLIVPPHGYRDGCSLLVPYSGWGSEVIGAIYAGWTRIVAIEEDAVRCRAASSRVVAWAGKRGLEVNVIVE